MTDATIALRLRMNRRQKRDHTRIARAFSIAHANKVMRERMRKPWIAPRVTRLIAGSATGAPGSLPDAGAGLGS